MPRHGGRRLAWLVVAAVLMAASTPARGGSAAGTAAASIRPSLATPPAACPPTIGFGETTRCSIDAPGEVDAYTFGAAAGSRVLVRMSRASGGLWPGVRVYDPAGTRLCEASHPVTAEISACTLPGGGTYTIQARDSSIGALGGDYGLHLQRLDGPGNAAPLLFGQTLAGAIGSPAEMGAYTFAAAAGSRVLVRMSRTSGGLWPAVRVYDPAGVRLCEASYPVTAEIPACHLSSAGAYTVLAYDGYTGYMTGDYRLHVQRLDGPANAAPLLVGQTVAGAIGSPAEADAYTFAAAGGDVLVRASRTSGGLWPAVRVYDPAGVRLCEASHQTTAVIPLCALPGAGTYAVLVHDGYDGTLTGTYSLCVQRVGAGCASYRVAVPLITRGANGP